MSQPSRPQVHAAQAKVLQDSHLHVILRLDVLAHSASRSLEVITMQISTDHNGRIGVVVIEQYASASLFFNMAVVSCD
eukprot:1961824-Amphidinium_carterae.1